MTKFINNSKPDGSPLKATKFIYSLGSQGEREPSDKQPKDYCEVEFLGKRNKDSLALFRARNTKTSTWGFFLGELGNEFLCNN